MALNSINNIVQINVNVQQAAQPSRLQNTAAIVSMGGTTTTAGTTTYINSKGALDAYLIAPLNIASADWDAGTVELTTATPHGIATSDTQQVLIKNISVSGSTNNAYNGLYTVTSTGTTTLTYAVATDPGTAVTTGGSLTLQAALALQAADKTWWAQNSTIVGYYIFESGSSSTSTTLTAVSSYLNANPNTIYNWGFLPGIDAEATANTFFTEYATLDLTNFFLPVAVSNITVWENQSDLVNVFVMVTSPSANAADELDSIAFMQYLTEFTPSSVNKLPPSQFTYLYGVTAYRPLPQSTIDLYIENNFNFVTTGAEGGLSNTILYPGKFLDGTPANVKYSVDWVRIQLNQAVSAAVIEGSNTPINPLYYNQAGINTLQSVAQTVGVRGVQCGLVFGQVLLTQLPQDEFINNLSNGKYRGNFVINAIPMREYTAANPSDYALQQYGGFTVAYAPQYGFLHIIFNLEVLKFV